MLWGEGAQRAYSSSLRQRFIVLIVGLRRAKCNPSGNQLTTSGGRQPLNGYVEAATRP
jgi:hypothetical protein